MNRRNFLKYSTLLGASTGLMSLPKTQLYAAGENYDGPLWLTVHAQGGWDPTSFCDPKGYNGAANVDAPARLNNYDSNDIVKVGNFNVAPPPNNFQAGGSNFNENLYTAEEFFTQYMNKLCVINGIDVETNSHSNGKLNTWSGKLRNGFPSFAALVAGTLASNLPMSYLINGGYSFPANLITPTRMDSRGLTALYEIAYPNRSVAAKNSNSATYFTDLVRQAINDATNSRLDRLQLSENLPRNLTALSNMKLSRAEIDRLATFATTIDAYDSKISDDFNGRTQAFNFYKQGRLALAAYEAGVTCSANVTMGGFDTHGDHDNRHYPRLMDLLMGLNGIMQEAELRGLSDRLVVVVGSDFGRTNKYNKNAGKDHWPITSMMFMGNSIQNIPGNRVIGATTDNHKAISVDPGTLDVDVDNTNPNSLRITPAHIHTALRKLAGISQSNNAINNPLNSLDLNLFGV